MNELIRIEEKNGIETVNARNLWEFLEVGKDFSDWIKLRIEKYGFDEDTDFTTILGKTSKTGGRPTIDYYISLSMAKELSMVENNEKGKQARQYFIECEKKMKKPLSLEEMTLLVVEGQKEKIKLLENKIHEDKPKVEFYEQVTSSKDAIEMKLVADVLNIKNLGRNKLFDFLRNKKILNESNTPYRTYIDRGYFRIIEQKYTTSDGETRINFKTIVYQSGLDYIRKLLKDDTNKVSENGWLYE